MSDINVIGNHAPRCKGGFFSGSDNARPDSFRVCDVCGAQPGQPCADRPHPDPAEREGIARRIRTDRLVAQQAGSMSIALSDRAPPEDCDLATADSIIARFIDPTRAYLASVLALRDKDDTELHAALARLTAAEAENARLREAMEPFATAADRFPNEGEGTHPDAWFPDHHDIRMERQLTVGDLRRAREALRPATPKENENAPTDR